MSLIREWELLGNAMHLMNGPGVTLPSNKARIPYLEPKMQLSRIARGSAILECAVGMTEMGLWQRNFKYS